MYFTDKIIFKLELTALLRLSMSNKQLLYLSTYGTMVDRTLFKLLVIMCCYESELMKVTQHCKGYDCLKAYVEKPDLAYTWTFMGED